MGRDEVTAKRRPRHNPWWFIAWALAIISVLLAIVIHRGWLGILGLVGAAVVARYMFFNRPWLTADPED
jgi:hypothetical protein